MNKNSGVIGQEVKEFILQEFLPGEDPDELTDTTPLLDGGILDSLGMIKLVTFIEERFNTVLELDAEHLATIKDIVASVNSKTRDQGGKPQ